MISYRSVYTHFHASSSSSEGLNCEMQVGNEINNGFLSPVGETSVNGLNPVSQLLHSAINGAKSVGSPKILLHLANGWDWSDLQWFFTGVFIQGALSNSQIDIIGVSFYPFYDAGATLTALKSSLTNLANLMGKDIVVAETDWPVACSGVKLTEPSISVSTAGQETWIKDIASVLDGLPNGHGKGICEYTSGGCGDRCTDACVAVYWEPSWIGNANLGSGCSVSLRLLYIHVLLTGPMIGPVQDNLLVSSNGATRTSIDIFNLMN